MTLVKSKLGIMELFSKFNFVRTSKLRAVDLYLEYIAAELIVANDASPKVNSSRTLLKPKSILRLDFIQEYNLNTRLTFNQKIPELVTGHLSNIETGLL